MKTCRDCGTEISTRFVYCKACKKKHKQIYNKKYFKAWYNNNKKKRETKHCKKCGTILENNRDWYCPDCFSKTQRLVRNKYKKGNNQNEISKN